MSAFAKASLYRRRARRRLSWARRALVRGQFDVADALIDEARCWMRFASDWARQAREVRAH